ncbi:helix-turn-helix domain-containing protein [Burkholderia pseudomultivorans]|uniref:helix-turn-helix domain-containing protein n=1 Tax=Burkholderia pseudomultivorans TaxID=1207504 RepID=UPI0009BDB3C3|nr:LysR family transcriptional regulator [Burkholderia pseudomultivorans]
MNLLEAMRVYVAVIEHDGLRGAACALQIDEADASDRIDGLERYLGCRLLLHGVHDELVCTEAGIAFHACCRRTLSAVERAVGERGAPAAGFALRGAVQRANGAATLPSGSLHHTSP